MTTVITRLFEDEETARYVAEKIVFLGVPGRAVSVITKDSAADADALKSKMTRAQVHESAIDTYAKHVQQGKALVAVRATYKPLMAATKVRESMAKRDTVDVGDVVDDYYMADGPEPTPSVLKEHPHFLTVRIDKTGYEGAPISRGLGIRLLSARKKRDSAIRGGGFKSRVFWPMPLLSTKPRKSSVISGGRFVSQSFWPMPLLSRKPRSNSVIRGGDLPLSRALGWPPVS
ncbi:hypothetical protein KX928_20725 [Roseobacter sp. YSTF-M11]|uniref:Uncharacterized protein n=1 Tax=Roseobacter insulae TaxID=2859783 RepID=A0A9X1K2G9_9RHOB|nr:hypothetical protein [Roseobacter insulae]MBW4710219.1 hypothetical protein [Roseobacter insulae]